MLFRFMPSPALAPAALWDGVGRAAEIAEAPLASDDVTAYLSMVYVKIAGLADGPARSAPLR
jgi:hypothetical protein